MLECYGTYSTNLGYSQDLGATKNISLPCISIFNILSTITDEEKRHSISHSTPVTLNKEGDIIRNSSQIIFMNTVP